MRGSLAPDLEETLREPLALTCCLPAAEIPVFESVYDAEDAATGYLDERPQRVIVRPLVSGNRKPAPKVNRQVRAIQPRPAPRKRPDPRAAVPQKPKRKVLPRANTIPNHPQGELSLGSLAMFWGVSLAGSLVAIGIALTAW